MGESASMSKVGMGNLHSITFVKKSSLIRDCLFGLGIAVLQGGSYGVEREFSFNVLAA